MSTRLVWDETRHGTPTASGFVLLPAIVATAAYFPTLSASGALGRFGPAEWASYVALLMLPLVGMAVVPAARSRRRVRAVYMLVAAVAHALPMLVLAQAAPDAGLFAVLLPLQWHLAVRPDDDRCAAAALAVALVQAFSAFAGTPTPLGAVALPLVLVLATVAAIFVHRRASRRRVRSFSSERPVARPGNGDTKWEVRFAVLVSLPLLLLTVIGLGAARSARGAIASFGVGGTAETAEVEERRRAGGSGWFGDWATFVTDADSRTFFADIRNAQTPGPEGYETVAQVTPYRGGARAGDLGPLYLRAVVHDRFTQGGIELSDRSRPPLRTDAQDGVTDGWTRFPEIPVADPQIELEIYQLPAPYEPEGWSLLLATYPVAGVSVARVRFDPDRVLVAEDAPDDWFTYRVAAGRSQAWFRSRARHSDPRFLQLPDNSTAVALLADEAARITADSATSFARVRAVMDYFRGGDFEYSLTDGAYGGLDGVAEFVRRKRGYCIHFASATVLMLRSLGVPSRVASGYLASRWNETAESYDVLGVDAHAWVEVHFEDAGWVRFDPTPPSGREREIERDWTERSESLDGWGQDVVRSLRAWVVDPAGEGSASDVLRALLRGPGLVARRLSNSTAALVVLAVALCLLLAVTLRRKLVLPRRTDPVQRARARAADAYTRLLRALARKGYRKLPSQTPREFALFVVDSGGGGFADLIPITERIYAARFGGVPLEPRDVERIDRFAATGPRDSRPGHV